MLLPSDTHRKPITSITTVLLPFVTYLLTLPLTTRIRVAKTGQKHAAYIPPQIHTNTTVLAASCWNNVTESKFICCQEETKVALSGIT
jgi:hypothetical protein